MAFWTDDIVVAGNDLGADNIDVQGSLFDQVFEALITNPQHTIQLQPTSVASKLKEQKHTPQLLHLSNGKRNFLPTASTSTIGSSGSSCLYSSSKSILSISSTNFFLSSLLSVLSSLFYILCFCSS